MIRRALLACTLLSGPVLAQTPFQGVGKATNPNAPTFSAQQYNADGASKADSTRLDAEIARALIAEAASVHGVSPDALKLPADGADDAPSIQRAITAACGSPAPLVVFLARHYALLSSIRQSCFVSWLGAGWREQNPVPATAPGTFFDIGPAFIGVTNSPIVVTTGSEGSVLAGFGITQPGHPAPPVPVVSGGAVTGWSPSTWTPAPYSPVLTIDGAPGVTVRDVMMLGVNAGFVCVGSGRCAFENIRGQVFAYMLNIQSAYDVSRIMNVQQWPYWSSADPVIQYQQASASTIVSVRNDTPMWDRIFTLGSRDGILILGGSDGSTTGLAAGTISCDFVQTCLRVDASAGHATMQVSSLRSYAQKWNTVAGAPTVMLPGSAAISLAGQTVAQIGNVESYGTDTAVVRLLGATPGAAATVHINSLVIYGERLSAGASAFAFPAGGGNTVTLNAILTTSPPSGYALTNTGNGQPGVGTLLMPTLATVR